MDLLYTNNFKVIAIYMLFLISLSLSVSFPLSRYVSISSAPTRDEMKVRIRTLSLLVLWITLNTLYIIFHTHGDGHTSLSPLDTLPGYTASLIHTHTKAWEWYWQIIYLHRTAWTGSQPKHNLLSNIVFTCLDEDNIRELTLNNDKPSTKATVPPTPWHWKHANLYYFLHPASTHTSQCHRKLPPWH